MAVPSGCYWSRRRHSFSPYFRIQKEGETEYATRSRSNIGMSRILNEELELEPGSAQSSSRLVKEALADGNELRSRFRQSYTEREDVEAKVTAAVLAGQGGSGSGWGADGTTLKTPGTGAGAGSGANKPAPASGGRVKGVRLSKPGSEGRFRESGAADKAAEEEDGGEGESVGTEGEVEESDSDNEGGDEENYWDAIVCVGLRILLRMLLDNDQDDGEKDVEGEED
ncbi:hypothetical protein HOY80DRAFT_1000412 [Tuber brumale]|nr:hypothetical protein HOY80DRAFT_1000412 [Tuber brumale]